MSEVISYVYGSLYMLYRHGDMQLIKRCKTREVAMLLALNGLSVGYDIVVIADEK